MTTVRFTDICCDSQLDRSNLRTRLTINLASLENIPLVLLGRLSLERYRYRIRSEPLQRCATSRGVFSDILSIRFRVLRVSHLTHNHRRGRTRTGFAGPFAFVYTVRR